jgi:hypothetical protein
MAGRLPGHFFEPTTRRRYTMAKPKTKRTRSRKLNLRDPDLKGDVEHFVQILIELHDESDPKHGKKTELGKMERARLAVHHWWRLYGRLMLWAQAHLTGYHIARDSPRWVDQLAAIRKSELDENSHELELLGLLFVANPPPPSYKATDELSRRIEKMEGGLDDESLRRIIDEFLLSTDANSSYWRFPLGRALRALNYGERDSFLVPSKKKARGKAYTLAYYRALAVAHVWYRRGKGIKKYVALESVATALAVGTETIRDWEKTLKDDDYFRHEWDAAYLAGHIEEIQDTMSRQEIVEQYTEWQFGFRTNVNMAYTFLDWSKNQWSLKSIKDELRKGHERS